MAKRLPPYGRDYLRELPRTGLQIAVGPTAWAFAKRMSFIVMVLPVGSDPFEFKWPRSDGAMLHERGEFNDELLERMATVLLLAGNPFVIARRSAMLDSDPVLEIMNVNPELQTGPKFDPDVYVQRDKYPSNHGEPMAWFYPKSSNEE